MKTFIEWMENQDLKFPADCSPRAIISKACKGGMCGMRHGTNHDQIVGPDGQVVTMVPRHRKIQPGTCKSIIKSVRTGCQNNEKTAELVKRGVEYENI